MKTTCNALNSRCRRLVAFLRHSRLPSTLPLIATIMVTHVAQTMQSAPAMDDWNRWQGPTEDSVWHEEGILEKFPEGGPTIKWRVPVRKGYSGPSVSDGRLFVMDRITRERREGDEPRTQPGEERILCLDVATGKKLWEHTYDCPYRISYPEGPRTTPVVEGDRVWTLGAMGHLKCLNVADGTVLWETQLAERYETRPPVWGFAATPRLIGDLLVLLVGGEGSAVVALNKSNGEEVWKALTAEEVGYAPPTLYQRGDERQLIYWYDVAISSLNPETGEVLWTVKTPDVEAVNRPVVTIVTPRFMDDLCYVSDYYNGSTMVRIKPNASGAEVVWRDKPQQSAYPDSLNILMTTPVINDGYIYSISGDGESRCIQAKDGAFVWRDKRPFDERKPDFATVFYVQQKDRFFLFTDQGDLVIAKLSPEGYEPIDQAHILDPVGFARGRDIVWSHPAFANRCMYARNDEELVCVDLAAPADSNSDQ